MKEIKFKYYFKHEDSERVISIVYKIEEIESYAGVLVPYRYCILQRSLFLGLKDKNGVEIYEGDIVLIDDDDIEVVGNIYENTKLLKEAK